MIAATTLDRLAIATKLSGNGNSLTQARMFSYAAENLASTRLEDLLARDAAQTTDDSTPDGPATDPGATEADPGAEQDPSLASPAEASLARLLAFTRGPAAGAEVSLLADESGDHPFDEACSTVWPCCATASSPA